MKTYSLTKFHTGDEIVFLHTGNTGVYRIGNMDEWSYRLYLIEDNGNPLDLGMHPMTWVDSKMRLHSTMKLGAGET